METAPLSSAVPGRVMHLDHACLHNNLVLVRQVNLHKVDVDVSKKFYVPVAVRTSVDWRLGCTLFPRVIQDSTKSAANESSQLREVDATAVSKKVRFVR